MKFSRRDVLKGMGAAGLTPMLSSGCGSDDSGIDLPPLPEYEFVGTPYRFFAQGRQSPIGRTRLAPTDDQTSRLRFGLCSYAHRRARGAVRFGRFPRGPGGAARQGNQFFGAA